MPCRTKGLKGKRKGKRYIGRRYRATWLKRPHYVHRDSKGRFAHWTRLKRAAKIERAKKAKTKTKAGFRYKGDAPRKRRRYPRLW